MKANELMIGDWVKYLAIGDKEEFCEIVGISMEDDSCFCRFDDGIYDTSNATLYPIPLTAEILEKNGWKCKVNGISTDVRGEIAKDVWFVMQLLDGYDHWNIRLSKVSAGETFDLFIQCKYVHELQRALRCCGLLDLANNIKIK